MTAVELRLAFDAGEAMIESGRDGKVGGRGEERVRISLNSLAYHAEASSVSESESISASNQAVATAADARGAAFALPSGVFLVMMRGWMEGDRKKSSSSSDECGVMGKLSVLEKGLEWE